jgi:hypothetical protein
MLLDGTGRDEGFGWVGIVTAKARRARCGVILLVPSLTSSLPGGRSALRADHLCCRPRASPGSSSHGMLTPRSLCSSSRSRRNSTVFRLPQP